MAKIRDGVYVINLDKYKSKGSHWIPLYVTSDYVTYFDIPKEIEKFIGNKYIKTSIYSMQAYNSIMCWYFCIGFIDYMLKREGLLDYTNLFSRSKYEKHDKIILKYFQ